MAKKIVIITSAIILLGVGYWTLSPEHAERILEDLAKLEDGGYSTSELERLRRIVAERTPYLHDAAPSPPPSQSQPLSPSSPQPPAQGGMTPKNCANNSSPVFTNHITDMSKVNYIVPPPTMGAGPSLKPHSYIGTDHARVPVYAPIAMTVKDGAHYVGGPYMFDFSASCEITVRFGHMTNPIDALKDLLPAEPASDSRTQELPSVSFAAGELIAYTTGTDMAGNWDFGVYNSATQNRYARRRFFISSHHIPTFYR